jgi:hypothetical protein
MKSTQSPRGRKPDASSKSGQVRELLKSGMAPMAIAKKVGCTPGLVYNVKSRISGGAKRSGRPAKGARPSTNGISGLDSILQAVRNTQTDVARYRDTLTRIGALLTDVLS